MVGYHCGRRERDEEQPVGPKEPNRNQGEETQQSRWGFRGMTVRDWLDLLVVPLALAVIGVAFSVQQDARQQRVENQRAKAERELAEQNAQDEALQAYLDQMSQLTLDRDLLEAERGDPAYVLAQARTSTAILRLDANHNESVASFLSDSGLSERSKTSGGLLNHIVLPQAKLSDANLQEADLSWADLRGADLSGAFLVGADLSHTYLKNADLSDTYLIGADLSDSDLQYSAKLSNADLTYADLSNARGITNEEIEQQASRLKKAIMPNGQEYEDWLKDREARKEDGDNE